MTRITTAVLGLLALLTLTSHADAQVPPQLPKVGGPPALSALIAPQLQPFIEKKEVAGFVIVVATPKDAKEEDSGYADVEADSLMGPQAIFWIASMSKPVTAAALLMLLDEGKLALDDPVGKYIPELADLKTADGKRVQVTLKQLLTHTSGMAEATSEEARAAKTLAEIIPAYAKRPVQFEPGSKWQYCQSGINTAARVVEVASGTSFDKFLDQRLFEPLGMTDTTFYLSEKQLPRLARSYKRTGDKLEAIPVNSVGILGGKSPTSRDRFPAGNGGLFSTGADYARFCQMLLNGGELNGRRYLKADSVKLMSTVQTGDLKTGFTPGNGWGIGCCVVREPQGVTAALSPGSFGHGGAYGTQAWIDPAKKRIYVLMVQRANFPNSDASELRRVFQEAAAPVKTSTVPYENDIRAFEAADKASPPPAGAVLFIGASSTRMWSTLAKDFPEQPVINRGFGGSQIADCIRFVDRIVIPYKPRLIVFQAGANDIAAGRSPEQVAADFKTFVEKVRDKLPDTRIAFQGINPAASRWAQAEKQQQANRLIKEYVQAQKNLDFIDLWQPFLGADGQPRDDLFLSDRLHNNAAGYRVRADVVRPHLK